MQGMLHVSPYSLWLKTIAPFLRKKRHLQLDAWGRYPSPDIENLINSPVNFIDKRCLQSREQCPTPWATERQFTRLINQIWMAGSVSDEFAQQVRDFSFEQLEACTKSFAFEECVQRKGLNAASEKHAEAPEIGRDWKRPGQANRSVSGKETLELD